MIGRTRTLLVACFLSAAGVACGGGGEDGDGGTGDGAGTPTSSEPITTTCNMTITGDTDSGIGSHTYEAIGNGSGPNDAAWARGTSVGSGAATSILCNHRETGADGSITIISWGLGISAAPTPMTFSDSTTNYDSFQASYTSPEGSAYCQIVPGSAGSLGTFDFEISSVLSSYRHDAMSVMQYDIRASGHAECPGYSAGSVAIDVSFSSVGN